MYEMNFFLFGNVILEIVHSPRRRFRVSFNVTKPFISDILIGEQDYVYTLDFCMNLPIKLTDSCICKENVSRI